VPVTAHTTDTQSRAAALREQLGHPVIDSDGHLVELMAVFMEYVRDHGDFFTGTAIEKEAAAVLAGS
jgi:hypothetical protein